MLSAILLLILTSLLVFFVYSWLKIHRQFRKAGIKFLPGLPIFGNSYRSALQWNHLHVDADKVYDAFPNEKYVGFMEGMLPLILVRDPDIIKQITVKDFGHFFDHKIHFGEDLFRDTLFFLKGNKWRDMRATLSPMFTGSKMRLMVPFMLESASNTVEYLKGFEGQEMEINSVINRYTNDAIALTAFGYTIDSFKDPNNKFYVTGQKLVNLSGTMRLKLLLFAVMPSLSRYFPIFDKELTGFFRDLAKDTIKYREENNIQRPDMFQLLIEAQKGALKSAANTENDSIGFATTKDYTVKGSHFREWNADEIAAQAFLFFFGGFESVSSVASMAIHELALNSNVQKKLYQEVKTSSLRHETLTYEAIKELNYLDCVVNETLRKWPPGVMLDRLCVKSYVLPPPREGGIPYTLNANDGVYIASMAIHKDKKYYPNPDEFDPERFSEENQANIKQYSYTPFGSGPRNCIGSRYGLLALKIIIYHIVLNFEILKSKKTMDPIRVQTQNLSVRCDGGTWIRLASRE